MNKGTLDGFIGFLRTCCSEDTHYVSHVCLHNRRCVCQLLSCTFLCVCLSASRSAYVCAHTKTILECKERSLNFLCFHLVARYHFLFQGVENTGPIGWRVSVCVHTHTHTVEGPCISQPVGQWVTNDCFFRCVLVFPYDLSSPKIYSVLAHKKKKLVFRQVGEKRSGFFSRTLGSCFSLWWLFALNSMRLRAMRGVCDL